MPLLRQFSNDVFISYAHADNTRQWVDAFETNLRNRLIQIGASADVWKDNKKLAGNDDFSDEILQQLKQSSLLISIITPSSYNSHWCEQERQKFEEFAPDTGGFRIANKMRAFKVVKTPIKDRLDRTLFQDQVGYEFFEFTQPDKFREFDPSETMFADKLNDLALDIQATLELMRQHLAQNAPAKKRVYLAETAKELQDRREELARQLDDWGYAVVPEHALEKDDSYLDQVKKAMEDCVLSVHLAGTERGTIPGNHTEPIGVLQYEAARALGKVRIFWFSARESEAPETIANAIGRFKLDKGPDVLENKSFGDLINIVGTRLRGYAVQPAHAPGAANRVFLVCDKPDHPFAPGARDVDPAVELKNYLEKQGFQVWLSPLSEASKKKWREDFRGTLKLSQAVVLYWGNTTELWFREKLRDLIENRDAVRGNQPLVVQVIYLDRPEKNEKRPYTSGTFLDLCIQQFAGFNPQAVQPLIERLQG